MEWNVVVADADNDMIAFSSDDELMEAVKNTTDGVLRVYINENQSALLGPLHYGVVCDGCEGEVRGIRHKCLICLDYDLCSKCQAAGLHSDHAMISIPQPLPTPEVSLFLPEEMFNYLAISGCHVIYLLCNLLITVLND